MEKDPRGNVIFCFTKHKDNTNTFDIWAILDINSPEEEQRETWMSFTLNILLYLLSLSL